MSIGAWGLLDGQLAAAPQPACCLLLLTSVSSHAAEQGNAPQLAEEGLARSCSSRAACTSFLLRLAWSVGCMKAEGWDGGEGRQAVLDASRHADACRNAACNAEVNHEYACQCQQRHLLHTSSPGQEKERSALLHTLGTVQALVSGSTQKPASDGSWEAGKPSVPQHLIMGGATDHCNHGFPAAKAAGAY